MKLRHKIGRLTFRRYVSKDFESRIRWALNLKPGDLVNDCTGFNRYLIETEVEKLHRRDHWFVYDVLFEVSDEKGNEEIAGNCSLKHCGVGPPLDRDILEQEVLKFLEFWLADPKGAKQWFGGLDNPERKEELELLLKKRDLLKAGKHITDKFGVRLPEFRKGI